MQDLFISLNNNKLRVSSVDAKSGFKSMQEEITNNVVNDSKIEDPITFSGILQETISKTVRKPKSSLNLNFILEPEDTILRFFTLNKGSSGSQEQIISEIKHDLGEINLDELYFSYQKIAPFLYQFIGVKKNILERYIEISNNIGISIKSIIPWLLVIPKYIQQADPAVFLIKRDDEQVVALSELGGIFFSISQKKEITSKELQNFADNLSLYKKLGPIKKIYSLNYEMLSLSDFDISKISLPVSGLADESTPGMEINILCNYISDTDPSLLNTQINALNLIPLPEVVKKKSILVYVGSTVLGLGLVASLVYFGIIKRNNNQINGELAQAVNQETSVLSTQSEVPESVPSEQKELKREDLRIRIENGTGVSGLAAKTRDSLNDKGYQVVSIDTAEEEREDTLLRFKESTKDFKDMMVKDLTGKIVDVKIEDNLEDSEEYDLLIVIGGNTAL
ncbi:MAG TPA: LytR C-terminal domain-containing protein [bacterium]|nr:LytR C-terminal domain-containing protein [bacterium]